MGNTNVLILAGILLCSKTCQGQGFLGDDFARSITASVDQLNRNIQQNIHQLQSQIMDSVQSRLGQVDSMTKDLHSRIAASAESTETMNSNPSGNAILISGTGGTVRTTFSSTSQDGEYLRDINETIMGDTLYHMEKIYDPKTMMTREYGYTLDLKDPDSKPVPMMPTQ